MKVVLFVLSLIITISVIIFLNTAFGKAPPLGKFLSPQHGFWQNAEPVDDKFSEDITIKGIAGTAQVYFDDRMVPHIFANDVKDAYFIQGYLHAKYRLWQMEFQTFAASGRLSEILGPGPDSAYLNNDRSMRRMGMVYGAKRSLSEMENDPASRNQLNAYTAGVNSYLSQLTASALPLEYRLLNYYPEKWSNLKTSLLLKYLSFDLTGSESDIEYTNAKTFFSEGDFNKLYPLQQDSASPIIPKGTIFPPPSVQVAIPTSADSLYYQWKKPVNVETIKTDPDNGSNNWAASGSKTKSGRPILCNDPHLGLNLPSLWYEIQITTPEFSVYGASLPGSPAIVIGFNDFIAWGVTNASRDVLDYFNIQFNKDNKSEYWYNNNWTKADLQIETYQMKDGSRYFDTVAYTVFGPVMFDNHFNGKGRAPANINLAIKWKAQERSNEFKTFNLLNSAKNYDDYVKAIKYFYCPGQNFAFASKTGDIAVWQQGQFPAKWYRQGDFILPGNNNNFNWQGFIPLDENPHIKNPERGFVSSANQVPADSSYPYYLGSDYDVYRGLMINRRLQNMSDITTQDMKDLQNENYNAFAETALPFLLKNVDEKELNADEKKYLGMVRNWNLRNDNNENGPTIFTNWFDALEQLVWNDELAKQPGTPKRPRSSTLIDALKKDSAFSFIDNIDTPEKETLRQVVTAALKRASTTLVFAEKDGKLAWNKFKDTGIRHLLRMEPLSRYHLNTGGGVNVINAIKQFQGPSWKMVVQLTDEIEAYGIYPGGQTGNPGSKEYDQFVNDWADGKYYRLWKMKKEEAGDKRVRSVIKMYPLR
jgi:penicillin amidase